MNHLKRNHRIALAALLPVVAALVAWAFESTNWLVIYNDGADPLHEIRMQTEAANWTVRELGPRESRRFRLKPGSNTELLVEVTDWAPEPPQHLFLDQRSASIVTLRLDSFHTVSPSTQSGIWERLLNW